MESESDDAALEAPDTEVVSLFMDDLDVALAKRGVALSQRPFQAATYFVRHMLQEIEGDTKDNFWEKPWFAGIFQSIQEWYRKRYREALRQNPTGKAAGVVLIFNTPFKLIVPLTTSRVEEHDKSASICFPIDVDSDEKPETWLVNGPNLVDLEESRRQAILEDIKFVARHLRSIRVHASGVKPTDDTLDGLLNGVLGHIEAAAESTVLADGEKAKEAFWNIQMACERAMKAVLQQQQGTFPETHDLFVLYDRMRPPLSAPRELLKRLPRWQEMAEMRYGMGPDTTHFDAYESYKAALRLVDSAVRSLKREIYFGGGRIFLKKPPWL